jgi:hypothetical protein
VILESLVIDIAAFGDEPEMALEALGNDVEVATRFSVPLDHLSFDFREALIGLGEALVDVGFQLPDRHFGFTFVGHPTIVLR